MDGVLVIVGLLVVPALIGALVALIAGRRRHAGAARPDVAERDAAVRAAIDHLVRVNQQMIAGERQVGAHELEGARTLIDRELGEMRGELHRLHALVEEVERERRRSAGELTSQLAATGRTTQALADSTQSLREALSSSTARGQWGERMADDVLQLAGFVDGVNYHRHRPLPGGGMPDYTFVLPQGLLLHMDVKFPLDNYMKHLDAPSNAERERHRRDFLRDVRLRVREVTTRDYVDPGANTVDCMLLFIPNEQVYGFIQQQDRTLLDDALRHKVVLCSPLTLFAVLAVIRQSVESFRISQSAQEVLTLLQGFQKQWDKFVEQMDKVGRSITAAGNAFEELEGTRRRQLERQLDRIEAFPTAACAGAPQAVVPPPVRSAATPGA